MTEIIDRLLKNQDLTDEEYLKLINEDFDLEYLQAAADKVRQKHYGKKVFLRGLIEISNYCKNDCFYCGIRCSNKAAERYRLNKEDILSCCEAGYELGFRTFVMQGGEDAYYTDDVMCDIISEIRKRYPDCAITLSLGERSFESYKKMFDAGANRYLLRHETASDEHYNKLHPERMSLSDRKECLFNLKKIGFQTGSGFMVGSPYQTAEYILEDIRFLQELKPEMIGIGPYITHKDTPFSMFKSGDVKLSLKLLSILRLMFPKALLPATTALGTAAEDGREKGLKAGANVIMPNLSPKDIRKLYNLYDNKLSTGAESAENLKLLEERVKRAGYEIVYERGDAIK